MEVIKLEEMNSKTGISAILYAPPKIGKTVMLAQLPGKTLLIDTDRGSVTLSDKEKCKSLGIDQSKITIIRIRSLQELEDIVKKLQAKCDYDNICIDTITEIRSSFLTDASKNSTDKLGNKMEIPQLNDYLKVKYTLSKILRDYKTLIDDGKNVIFTAWEGFVKKTDASGNETHVAVPQVGGKSIEDINEIAGLVDVVGRLRINSEGNRMVQLSPINDDCISGDRIYERKFCLPQELLNQTKITKTEIKTENKETK